ncbi:MAG TPA: hypothetical protein VFQ96_02600, partial [Microbacteriaceae bacterium]|nr:hypothetical protein [Microbacteriaceae bacterium]
RRWAHTLLANTPDDGSTSPLMTVLSRIGFAPEDPASPAPERTIRLHACPFRDAANDYPNVVCSVHRGLVDGSLEHCGKTAKDAVLKPFVGPHLCEVEMLASDTAADEKPAALE